MIVVNIITDITVLLTIFIGFLSIYGGVAVQLLNSLLEILFLKMLIDKNNKITWLSIKNIRSLQSSILNIYNIMTFFNINLRSPNGTGIH